MSVTHSDLGASGSHRWINCPGSVTLLRRHDLPETDDPEYRENGTAAHDAAAECLLAGEDSWSVAGTKRSNGVTVTPEMANAIQAYLDVVRPVQARASQFWIETSIAHPEFHKLFFGTADFAALLDEPHPTNPDARHRSVLEIDDFKYGEGIVVEAYRNPQLMYYAFGTLLNLDKLGIDVDFVRMRIVQPRVTWFKDEPYEISVLDLRQWANDVLWPAMILADSENGDLSPGEHCRFCPRKLACPVLVGMYGAAANANISTVIGMDDATLAREYPNIAAVKQYIKALETETFRRMQAGVEIGGLKMVHMKANRVWKEGAAKIFQNMLGKEALSEPELKSPAEMEKINSVAKAKVREYSYTPVGNLTVATEDDKRPGVKVQTLTELMKEGT